MTIKGLTDNGRRISSQKFEIKVQEAAKKTNTLILETFGQHNIGGRLARKDGEIYITVNGPVGQRLGCMGQPGTSITCNGPASDDVGYLNIGASITVLGDATNGICNAMAQGRVMIKGSIGARGLTMTKWNPDYVRPQLWVLGSVGDTFAEFNCGGIGVVCGVEPKSDNVLGYRPCVGMVGGWIYYRGTTDESYSRTNVREALPDDEQWQWLMQRLPEYLSTINRSDLIETLSKREEWKILISITPQERALMFSGPMPMEQFRTQIWDKALGGDPLRDLAPALDRSPIGLVESGELRRRQPHWANRASAAPCTFYCPVHIPTVDRLSLIREGKLDEAYKLILDYTPLPASVCGAICPNPCVEDCTRLRVDKRIDQGLLGRAVLNAAPPAPKPATGKKVAIIGSGPAGLNAAWQLAREGIAAHIFEKEAVLGGKLAQTIPWERLPKATWEKELDRFSGYPGITVNLGTDVNKTKLNNIKKDYDFVIVAAGTHEPRRLTFPGSDRVITALDFLKAAKSEHPISVGSQVVIIGAGNVGCDVACEAYQLGAEQVTLIDIQQPLAFGKEKEAAEALGATFTWPVATKEVTAEGLIDTEDNLIPAQTVIISIGDVPALDFLPESVETIRGWIMTDEAGRTSDPKIIAVGDVEKPGLATDALGSGKRAAEAIICAIRNETWQPFNLPLVPQDRLTTEHYCPTRQSGGTDQEEAGRCLSCGSCRDCHLCETICPEAAISRRDLSNGQFEYVADPEKCIACGFCCDTCPCGIWVNQLL
ncbi:MAG: FAD-dependent oxidoreductase [Deltaproteobacteria bacterium]|nr:FAD-dependent oxidoreductase [Deltaproteobacteria bacterium]